MPYGLRYSVYGHSKEIRSVAALDNLIITGSKDSTVKLWTEKDNEYEETTTITCHPKSVNAVCAVYPSEDFPSGLIFSGSHDENIFGYVPYSTEAAIILEGHTHPVCWVTASKLEGHLLSSSYDGTAKIWNILTQRCYITFFGHTGTVWCAINMPGKWTVTAGEDKLIKVFRLDGSCIHSLEGHTDAVRCLAQLSRKWFLSCSSDGTVRKWNVINGECLGIFELHDKAIYSIAVRKPVTAFVGEDGILTIWKNNAVFSRETIKHPITNVWTVAILPNYDVVTGSSDGVLRIYTNDLTRRVSNERIIELDREFRRKKNASIFTVIKKKCKDPDLPGKEYLNIPGYFDGEIRLLQHNGSNYCYRWNGKDCIWVILREEALPKSKPMKHIYEGKEYDYLFEIDINKNEKYLLPYNKGDDPTTVAKQFIIDNTLDPDNLDRVVSFLGEHTGQELSNVPSTSSSRPEGYIFVSRNYYPPKSYKKFELNDLDIVENRLRSVMLRMNYPKREAETTTKILVDLLAGRYTDTEEIKSGVHLLLTTFEEWKIEHLQPILDAVRIAALDPTLHPLIFSKGRTKKIMNMVTIYVDRLTFLPNDVAFFRLLSNMFCQEKGKKIVYQNRFKLLEKITNLANVDHRSLQIAVTTFLMNMSLVALEKACFPTARLCCQYIRYISRWISDPEALYRLLVTLGTVALLEGSSVITKDLVEFLRIVSSWKIHNPNCKAASCADVILNDYVESA